MGDKINELEITIDDVTHIFEGVGAARRFHPKFDCKLNSNGEISINESNNNLGGIKLDILFGSVVDKLLRDYACKWDENKDFIKTLCIKHSLGKVMLSKCWFPREESMTFNSDIEDNKIISWIIHCENINFIFE